MVACVGYRPDPSLTTELRVAEPAGGTVTGEPGYFVLGQKSAGRGGSFLLSDGHRQIREVLAQVQRPQLQVGKRAA